MQHIKRTHALKDNQIQEVDDSDVEFEIQSPTKFFGTHINLIPVQSAVQAPRLFYGARFYNQAMPVRNNEVPLVQNLDPEDSEGRSFDDIMGRQAGALFVDDDDDGAVVDSVSDDDIVIRRPDGTRRTIPIMNNLPLNRKSNIRQTPLVKKGDTLKARQIMARSNYTDDNGSLALGINARVGLLPFKGMTYEDAWVVSESFAKRLESDHAYTVGQQWDRDTKGGKNHYKSLFPATYTKEQMETLDDDGVVKPGTVVNPGDPVVLATRPRVFSSTSAQLGSLSKAMRQSRHDATQVWDGQVPGTVTDVAKTSKGVKVQIQAYTPTKEGDKIVCYDDTTEALTMSGWKPVKDIEVGEVCYTMDDDGALALSPVVKSHKLHYRGPMHVKENAMASICVTPDHELWACVTSRTAGRRGYGFITARDLLGKTYKVKCDVDSNPLGLTPSHVVPGLPEHGTYPTKPFMRVLGYVLAQPTPLAMGAFDGVVRLRIRPSCLADIRAALDACDLPHEYVDKGFILSIPHAPLASYVADLYADSCTRRIPDFAWSLSQELLVGLFEGMMLSVPRRSKHEYPRFRTESQTLADDFQRLCLLVGKAPKNMGYVQKYRAYVILPNGTKYGQTILKGHERHVLHDGDVYCVTLAEHNRIYTRRNGRSCWNGQCRSGQKGVIGTIVPDDQMPRTMDGTPMEVLLAPTGIPSRSNASIIYELLLGKVAEKDGKPIKVPGFNKPEEQWHAFVRKELERAGVSETEEMFDPTTNRKLNNPVTVGNAYFLKLHHVASDKISARGQGGYDSSLQPLKGGSESAQAKRLSGLELHAMLSSGAYHNLREGSTIRGTKSDDFWRAMRSGQTPRPPGKPFVWDKFKVLLQGAGMTSKDLGDGRLRLGPFTDDELDKHNPVEVETGETVDIHTLEPIKGGLFDQALVGNNKWGKVTMPFEMPNPAFENAIRHILGITEKELRGILAGRTELPEHLR